jgi:hypothetical protein
MQWRERLIVPKARQVEFFRVSEKKYRDLWNMRTKLSIKLNNLFRFDLIKKTIL